MQELDQTLYKRCQEYLPDYMKLWETFVNIDTGTGYGQGLSEVGNLAAAFLREQGAEVRLVPSDQPDAGFNVVGVFKGHGRGKVLAMAHMDTVFAPGTAAERPFRTDGEWAYGPGVSDCKGGVTLCLQAMRLLQERRFSDFGRITCLFNCDEETGSPSSYHLIQELAAAHDYVLCLEPGQVGDGVVIWRKGSAVLEVAVRGRGSHAGSAPDEGRNALTELTHQVTQLSRLGDASKQTTLNFTTFHAGDRTNVIPDYAVARADIRVTDPLELERIEREAQQLAAVTLIPDTTVTITLHRKNPPFPQNEGTARLAAKAQSIYAELGKNLLLVGAGGASDANWAAAAGATVMDGLGPVKGGPNHTANEKTKLDSIVPRLYLLTRLFIELGSGN